MTFLLTLLCTGYRNILRLIEREPEAGRLRLGFFALICTTYRSRVPINGSRVDCFYLRHNQSPGNSTCPGAPYG